MKLQDKEDYREKLQGKKEWKGINISIENKKGSIRRGVSPDGTPWEIKMKYAYGRIPRTEGNDGDNVDVIIGPDLDSDLVFIVHQTTPYIKGWDEDKVIIGAKSQKQAESIFKSMYNMDGFLGPIDIVSVEVLKDMLKNSKKGKPLGSTRVTDAVNNLAMGIMIEMEHTDNVEEAKKIAEDHLRENPNYYLDPRNPFIQELHSELMKMVQESDQIRGKVTDPKAAIGALSPGADAEPEEIDDDYIGFKELVKKLVKEGKSEESAKKIAYSIGVKKYGKAGMAKKSAAGRDSEEIDDAGILAEALVTPVIRALMQKIGFNRLRWVGRGWYVPITGGQYTTLLAKAAMLKAFDNQLLKLGYQIRLNPAGFFIEPVNGGNGNGKPQVGDESINPSEAFRYLSGWAKNINTFFGYSGLENDSKPILRMILSIGKDLGKNDISDITSLKAIKKQNNLYRALAGKADPKWKNEIIKLIGLSDQYITKLLGVLK